MNEFRAKIFRARQHTRSFLRTGLQRGCPAMLAFSPGIFLIVAGIVTVLAPKLVLAMVATLCLLFGAVLCYVAWQLIQLKRKLQLKFQTVAKQFQGVMFVRGSDSGSQPFAASENNEHTDTHSDSKLTREQSPLADFEEFEFKKVIVH